MFSSGGLLLVNVARSDRPNGVGARLRTTAAAPSHVQRLRKGFVHVLHTVSRSAVLPVAMIWVVIMVF